MHYWLVKSEPETYSWATLVKEGRTAWSGVRNYQAGRQQLERGAGDGAGGFDGGPRLIST